MRAPQVALATATIIMTASGLTACSQPSPASADAFAVISPPKGAYNVPTLADMHGDDAILRMPHLGLKVPSYEVSKELDERDAKDFKLGQSDMTAAAGHEFVMATIETTPSIYPQSSDVTVAVNADGAPQDIAEHVGEHKQTAILASVPTGEPVELLIEDNGVEVAIDLRTGERIDSEGLKQTRTYYLPGAMAELSPESQELTASVANSLGIQGEVELHVSFEEASAQRVPWIDGQDWADEGSAYLVISGFREHMSDPDGTTCIPLWNPSAAMSFKPDKESAVDVIHLEPSDKNVYGGAVVFPVPEDMTEGTLTIKPKVSVLETCSVTEPMPPTEIPIDLVPGD